MWQRSGEVGMISEPYRVGKYYVNNAVRYGLFFGYESLGYFEKFEDAQEAAERHQQREVLEGRT